MNAKKITAMGILEMCPGLSESMDKILEKCGLEYTQNTLEDTNLNNTSNHKKLYLFSHTKDIAR